MFSLFYQSFIGKGLNFRRPPSFCTPLGSATRSKIIVTPKTVQTG